MSTAAKVAQDKAKHPEKFCPAPRCLWRTGTGEVCPRHKGEQETQPIDTQRAKGVSMLKPEAPFKAQARQIATLYNALAQAEARPDLEEHHE